MQLKLSSLICRVIVLQKYTVCFREEPRLEDCEFYLTAQQFIVLPMERQRLESSDGYVLQALWGPLLWWLLHLPRTALTLRPSVSQLIDAIGQNQLEVLKENAEECLDLGMPKENPATEKDEVPITQWEAERKAEQGEDIFMVPAHALVISSEEEVVACHAPTADTCEATPGKSSNERMVSDDPSVISQASSAESIALSENLEGSLDNPWNRLPGISLTLNSSDEKTSQHDLSPKSQQDVAADSDTSTSLELCSQDPPEDLPPGELVQSSSPFLPYSYDTLSPRQTGETRSRSAAEAASSILSPAQGLEVLGGSQDTAPSLSPAFPVLRSSCLRVPPEKKLH
ncbi:ACD protein, partial [Centropus bengalensis]|nr:ACD protein [Centropus bengalensis]